MNRNLWLLAGLQGLFLTNNVTFIAINGLVGLALAPVAWMATVPVLGYVVGGALFTGVVAWTQARFGRKASFALGLAVALMSALLCAFAVYTKSFWLVCVATVLAGYYSANGQLYRFAAAELASSAAREKAVSLVLAGGLVGAVAGPNLATYTRGLTDAPFAAAYLALAAVAVLGLGLLTAIRFPAPVAMSAARAGRPLGDIVRQPAFIVAAGGSALGYGVMNMLMAASPLAMQHFGHPFSDTAFVLEWHVIGMFAPGFFTGSLIKRIGALTVMGTGVLLNLACIAIALSGVELHHFTAALFLLGVGWNFLFVGGTTLALTTYKPEEKDRAQAVLNFALFAVMAISSFSAGALVTTQGWTILNLGAIVPALLTGAGVLWLVVRNRSPRAHVASHR